MSEFLSSRRNFMKSAAAGVAALTAGGVAHAKASEKALPKFDMECDVLVIGLGLAGEGAAITAARAGAKVIVIDKRVWTGGDGLLSEGVFFAFDTSVHKAQGFTAKDKISFDDFWTEQCRGLMDDDVMNNVRDNGRNSPMYHAYNKHNVEVMKAIAANDRNVIEFMVDYGIEFKPIDPQLRFLHCVKRGEMSRFSKKCHEELVSRNVPVITGLRAYELVQDEKGDVVGVMAEYLMGAKKGEKIAIRAKKTILATGGFVDNQAMMERYKNYWSRIPAGWAAPGEGIPSDHTGDGIQMAKKIGAELESMESVPKFIGGGPKKGVMIPSWTIFYYDPAYFIAPNGKRILNEFVCWYTGCACALVYTGFEKGYVLFDQETFDGKNHDYWDLDECVRSGGLFKADTPEELAAKVGLDPKALRETIERINRDAKAGVDTEFGRTDTHFRALKAPYYISAAGYPCRYKTEGGVEVNPNMQVLRGVDDQPIGNLYAAGAGCGSSSTRNADCFSGGMLAGAHAVKSIKG